MANGHGGARPGAGRKKKALSEKIMDGNPGKAPLTKLQFEIQKTDMHGEDMPPVAEYLKQVTKNSQQNLAPQIYEDTWRWLNERGCAIYVKKELIEQYAENPEDLTETVYAYVPIEVIGEVIKKHGGFAGEERER